MAMSDLVPWGRNRNVSNVSGPQHAEQARPFLTLRQEMDRLFDNVFRGFDLPMTAPLAWATGPWPHVEVTDGDDQVKVVAELPGMEEKDIEVSLEEGILTLKGEKKSESNDSTYSERWHGQFARALQLGPDVDPDRVTAAFKNGVLTRALARYQGQGVWGRDPVLPEEGFDRLRRALLGSGFLKRAVPSAECVDNRLAEAAVAVGN